MKKENGVQIINVHLFTSKSRGKKNKNTGACQSLPSNPNQREKSIPKPKLFYNSFHQKGTNCLNYELLINKLLKYIKKTFAENQYLDIKKYIQNEISQLSSSSIDQNESQSSIFNASPPKNAISITENSEMRSVNFPHHSKVLVNKDKNLKKEKKLKLSYDFSNLLTSPKPKPVKIEISNIKKVNNQNSSTTPSSKKTNIGGTKDIHSLYTIIKKGDRTTTKSNNQKPSKTQSNSKSKSKSTSRDCSNNHYSNTNSNINQNLTNNNNLKKVTTVKQTLITKSQPLLNEKLFSKLNLNINCQNNPSNCNTITNVRSGNTSSNPKSKIKPKSKVNHQNKTNSNNRTNSKCSKNNMCNNKQIQISSNSNLKKDNKKNQNKTTITLQEKNNLLCYENEKNNQINSNKENKIKSQYIDLNLEKSSSINNINKNEEMMKQIKNTLDENLKVIFNFSYENFLSKESESESKKSSQQEIMINDQNEVNQKK